MSWTVSLNLGLGNLQHGCEEIKAQVSADRLVSASANTGTPKPLQIRGSLPPTPEIEQL